MVKIDYSITGDNSGVTHQSNKLRRQINVTLICNIRVVNFYEKINLTKQEQSLLDSEMYSMSAGKVAIM